MSSEEFQGAIDEAKRLERKMVEYAPYEGDITIERTLDLEPKDFVDLGYADLLNMYERSRKIISTVGMGILATEGAAAPGGEAPKAETTEVESKLREMTTETLKTAEEVAKEPMSVEREAPPAPVPEAARPEEAPHVREIEFESKTAEAAPEKPAIELEKEKPAPAVEMELPHEAAPPAPVQEKPEPRPAPMPEAPVEKKMIVAAVPPSLRESPDKAASRRYEQMEEQIRAAVGERADEMTLKKKMLDLTKQLFKEKSTSRREEIKVQITVLKNMLAGGPAPKAAAGGRKAAAAAPGGDAHIKLFEAMVSTHQGELSQTKDTIIDSYNKQIASIKKKFYDDISGTEDAAKRKQIFEGFVFSVESLVEQLPEVLSKYKEFTSKKHAAELERILASLGPDELETKAKVEERLTRVRANYEEDFAAVKGIVGRQIENLIEVAGSEIFKKPEEKPPEAEAKAHEIVKEINETDEGTLLYFLHGKDPEYYKRYERKQLSKAEAIFKAKELMAKEKGLSDNMVRKYFSQTEG
ncbi:MAG: hypothetical protein AB1529_06010 [Candidatus Micrarchaeota archaeon]